MDRTNYHAELSGKRVLHFAPEPAIKKIVESWKPSEYIRADLNPKAPDVQMVDITKLHFENEAFECVIANHVLEHVADDGAALAEIGRVLAPGGLAILQTPFALGLDKKLEDALIRTDSERLHAYGQEDHVRLYGRDFVGYVCTLSGLKRCGGSHSELLPHIDAQEYGVNQAEPFLSFRKTTRS